jgi:hypothetical protein
VSAGTAVQREFGGSHAFRPRVKLVLGADKNRLDVDTGEIELIRRDRGLFSEGVMLLKFEELMPAQQRLTIAKRAVKLSR